MPRYYCDYCDTYLTHDSPAVRKQHNTGYKHKANVRNYFQIFDEVREQRILDARMGPGAGGPHMPMGMPMMMAGRAHIPGMMPRLPMPMPMGGPGGPPPGMGMGPPMGYRGPPPFGGPGHPGMGPPPGWGDRADPVGHLQG